MIKKHFSEIELLEFTRTHKYTKSFNKEKSDSSPVKYQILKFVNLEHPNMKKILTWCSENCNFRYDVCQWHLGYGNSIFIKFYANNDYSKFYTFYDSNFFPRIDVRIGDN